MAAAESHIWSGDCFGFLYSATVEDVSDCLKAGADVNEIGRKHGKPPLFHAAYDKPALIEVLLKAGADVNARDSLGKTPLHMAQSSEAVELLAAAGADPNAIAINRTPLAFYFMEKGRLVDPTLITAFLAAGADPYFIYTDLTGKAPVSGNFPRMSILEVAKKHHGPEVVAAFSQSAIAAYKENQRKVAAVARKKQVEEKVKAAQVSCDGWNTGTFFRNADAKDVARCLKTKDPNARGDKSRTPLHLVAMSSKEPAVVAALSNAGSELGARDEEGRTPLHLAVVFGKSPAVVTALVRAGADIDALDKKGRTPLEFGEKFGDTPALVSALKEAKDMPSLSVKGGSNGSCEKWNTAAFFKNANVANLSRCLETEDPNARNENGRTPLHYAAQGRAPLFVSVLAEAGAEVNARDKRGGWTALHLAAWFGKSRTVVQALLDAGANPDLKDNTGRTPWDYLKENPVLKEFDPQNLESSCEDWNTASFFGRANAADVGRCLEAGANVSARDETGATPLHLAAKHGKSATVMAALVKSGARLGARDDTGATPLHAAAKSTSPEIVNALLDAGANPAARDEAERTPWDYVRANPALEDADLKSRLAGAPCESWNTGSFFERADAEDVARCLEAGAKVGARDETGATPLHLAAAHGTSSAVVNALVEAGARVSARDEKGATPLHSAASKGKSVAVLQALLVAGADPEAKDESGKTPWNYLNENDGLKETDLSRGLAGVSCEDWNTSLFFERADTSDVSRCIESGAKVDVRNESDATPLHFAALKSEVPAVVQALLDAGADPAARDGQGKSPWDHAKGNPSLKGTEVYWQLNEGRFN